MGRDNTLINEDELDPYLKKTVLISCRPKECALHVLFVEASFIFTIPHALGTSFKPKALLFCQYRPFEPTSHCLKVEANATSGLFVKI